MTTTRVSGPVLLSRLAAQWNPVLPDVAVQADESEYYERFDALVTEMKRNASNGHSRSTSALAGQALEFVLKTALERKGVRRADLSRSSGALHALVTKAQDNGLLFNPQSVLDSHGKLNVHLLDAIPHRDLVQHSILQAREYRNKASHADPWNDPPDVIQATRQLGAVIAIVEYLAPTLPDPSGYTGDSHLDRFHFLRNQNVDLAVAFLPDRSVNTVNEMVASLRGESDALTDLLDAIARNPSWLFARSSRTTLPDLRLLIQTLHATGYTSISQSAAVLLPVNDLALTYIVRRGGQSLCDHMMMARAADPRLFGSLLSSVNAYPAFVDEFVKQVKGTSNKGETLQKRDYLARAFSSLPARMRNLIMVKLGTQASVDWMKAIQFGYEPAILRNMSDGAVAADPALGDIRSALREIFVARLRVARARHIVHSYLNFAHAQVGTYRVECYENILAAVQDQIGDAEQEPASCRAVLEIGLSVNRRGPTWIRSQSVSAIGAESSTNAAVRLAYSLIVQGFAVPPLLDVERVELALLDLDSLMEQDALTAFIVTSATYFLANSLSDELRSLLLEKDRAAGAIVKSNVKPDKPLNIIYAFALGLRPMPQV